MICLIMLFLSDSLRAQISLGTVRNKAKSKIEENKNPDEPKRGDDTKPADKESKSESKSEVEKEKAAIVASPASSILWDLRSDLSYTEGLVGKDDFESYEVKLQKYIDDVEKQDPTFSYLPQYKERLKKASARHHAKEHQWGVTGYLQGFENSRASFPNALGEFNRHKFDSITELYNGLVETEMSNEVLDRQHANAVQFYKDEDQNVQKIMEKYGNVELKADMWSKTARMSPDYIKNLNSQTMKFGIKDAVTEIDEHINKFEKAQSIYPKNAALTNHVNKLVALQKDVSAYGASDQFITDIERVKTQEASEQRMSQPKMKDTSVDSYVKSKMSANSSEITVKRVVITYDDWYTKKSSAGVPLSQHLSVEVAYSYKGNCYFIIGELYKENLGGGRYSEIKLDHNLKDMTDLDKNIKINCENVFK